MIVVASLVTVALSAALLVVSEPLLLLLAVTLFFYIWLLSGFLIIPPAKASRRKVYCIGLSRTGTTSITVALKQLGFAAHHQCHALVAHDNDGKPTVCKFWADAFDAHSDIAPATVFEELASLYPDARFVLTRRPAQWAGDDSFHHQIPPHPRQPAGGDDVCGRLRQTLGELHGANGLGYEAHEKKVDAVFQSTPHRLLKLDIVEGAAKGQHAKLWTSLCTFLGEDQSIPKPGTPSLTRTFVLSA